jgi:hypothetical protein
LFQVTTKSRGALVICNISDRCPQEMHSGDETKPALAEIKIPLLLREQQSTDKPKEGARWRFWKWPWGRSS